MIHIEDTFLKFSIENKKKRIKQKNEEINLTKFWRYFALYTSCMSEFDHNIIPIAVINHYK